MDLRSLRRFDAPTNGDIGAGAQTPPAPARRLALHANRCAPCAAALERSSSGVKAFHAMCPRGKALAMPTFTPASRDYIRAADAFLASLDRAVAS